MPQVAVEREQGNRVQPSLFGSKGEALQAPSQIANSWPKHIDLPWSYVWLYDSAQAVTFAIEIAHPNYGSNRCLTMCVTVTQTWRRHDYSPRSTA